MVMLGSFCQKVPRKVNDMNKSSEDTFLKQRKQMVDWQILNRGIKDKRVLDAMLSVQRHKFVPERVQQYAYYDEPLPIGNGQTISQPYIVAFMTEALGLKGTEKVLEIGTGSGYQAAVLAEIVSSVYTIEIVKSLAEKAINILQKENYNNIQCRIGDGYGGWPEEAPFDAIIVTAAPPKIPTPLIEQLREGGKMIIPVGTSFQQLILLNKKNGKIEKETLLPVRFVPMTGEIQNSKK